MVGPRREVLCSFMQCSSSKFNDIHASRRDWSLHEGGRSEPSSHTAYTTTFLNARGVHLQHAFLHADRSDLFWEAVHMKMFGWLTWVANPSCRTLTMLPSDCNVKASLVFSLVSPPCTSRVRSIPRHTNAAYKFLLDARPSRAYFSHFAVQFQRHIPGAQNWEINQRDRPRHLKHRKFKPGTSKAVLLSLVAPYYVLVLYSGTTTRSENHRPSTSRSSLNTPTETTPREYFRGSHQQGRTCSTAKLSLPTKFDEYLRSQPVAFARRARFTAIKSKT